MNSHFYWNQVSPKKSIVELKKSNCEKPKFVAPEIDTKSLVLTFSVTVHDSKGAKGFDTVRVKVNNLVEQQTDIASFCSCNRGFIYLGIENIMEKSWAYRMWIHRARDACNRDIFFRSESMPSISFSSLSIWPIVSSDYHRQPLTA